MPTEHFPFSIPTSYTEYKGFLIGQDFETGFWYIYTNTDPPILCTGSSTMFESLTAARAYIDVITQA
jgi:hypothetical protein